MDNVNIRLSALEYLVRGLWGLLLANLPEEDARSLGGSVVERSRTWEQKTDGPRDVAEIEQEVQLISAWVAFQIEGAHLVEKGFRRNAAKGKAR